MESGYKNQRAAVLFLPADAPAPRSLRLSLLLVYYCHTGEKYCSTVQHFCSDDHNYNCSAVQHLQCTTVQRFQQPSEV